MLLRAMLLHHPFDIHAKAEHVFIEGKQEC